MLHAPTPADLIDKVYKVQGWKKVEGESRARRVNELYDITKNDRRNRYEATQRLPATASVFKGYEAGDPFGIREFQFMVPSASPKASKWRTGYLVRVAASGRLVIREVEKEVLYQWVDDNALDVAIVPKFGPGPATWQATFDKLTDATHFWFRFSDGVHA